MLYWIISESIFGEFFLKMKAVNQNQMNFHKFSLPQKENNLKLSLIELKIFKVACLKKIMKFNSIHDYSRFTDIRPSIAEGVIRTIRTSLRKTIFQVGNASWIIDLPSVIQKN